MDPKTKIATWAKWGIGLGAAAIVAPFIFLAVQGLIGAAIAVVVGLAIVNFAPVVAMKFANWKLVGIKHEARTSPVETLQNQLIERGEVLAGFLRSISEFSAAVKGFEGKVAVFRQQQPDQALRFEQQLKGMQDLLELRRQRYREASQELDRFEMAIERASALWDMSVEAQKMNNLAGQQDGNVFDRIKTDVAFDSIESNLNRAFAELETSLLEERPKALANQPADVIEVGTVGSREIAR